MEASLFNSLQLLIRFWENSSEPWGVKDNQSRYVYANNRLHRLLALPDKFNMEGRTDGELPTPISEFQPEYQEHDRKVKLLQDRITSVEIHAWDGRSYYQPYFVDKYPLMDENGVSQGVICHGRPVEDVVLTYLNKIKIPISLILTPPSDFFQKESGRCYFISCIHSQVQRLRRNSIYPPEKSIISHRKYIRRLLFPGDNRWWIIVMKIRSLTMFLRASSNTQVHSH